jgi:diguanylate cyclase (GGDEF)-like protein
MPHTDLAHARAIAEKLRLLLTAEPLLEQISVSASFGVAQWHRGQPLSGLVGCADQMLYRAKQLGRNRVECLESVDVSPSP